MKNPPSGRIEVICGSMFSGKTEELIRRLRRAVIARQTVEIFKPLTDKRYADEDVVSHDANRLSCTPVSSAMNILLLFQGAQVIGLDEAQFFDEDVVYVCRELANKGVRVIVAGLDMDYMGRPFGYMPSLMAIADDVQKVHAICQNCGAEALFSHRITSGSNLIHLGEKDHYIPLCRSCFSKANFAP